MNSIAAMSRARARLRQISLGALLLTVVMLGTCSATGVVNARGMGAQLIWRDPASYLSTIALLAGPLLLLLAFSALLCAPLAGNRPRVRASTPPIAGKRRAERAERPLPANGERSAPRRRTATGLGPPEW